MQRYHQFLIFSILFFCGTAQASGIFIDALRWRVTDTNDWVYNNSLTVPNQILDYKGIEFNYNTGVRVGGFYEKNNNDLLLAYTHFYTTARDSATGNLQPSFIGSVTAKPSPAYLYTSGNVYQKINYNVIDLALGRSFHPAQAIRLHPYIGIMGGWIDQTINAQYYGSTSSNEELINDFKGFGPKIGIETEIQIVDYHNLQPQLFASFATAYIIGNWHLRDSTSVIPSRTINVISSNPRMGAITLQGAIGFKLDYKQLQVKLAYEMNDWRDQNQFFDNDTGAHNNDLILQGFTLGINYNF